MIFFVFRILLLLIGIMVLFSFLRSRYQQRIEKSSEVSKKEEKKEDDWSEF